MKFKNKLSRLTRFNLKQLIGTHHLFLQLSNELNRCWRLRVQWKLNKVMIVFFNNKKKYIYICVPIFRWFHFFFFSFSTSKWNIVQGTFWSTNHLLNNKFLIYIYDDNIIEFDETWRCWFNWWYTGFWSTMLIVPRTTVLSTVNPCVNFGDQVLFQSCWCLKFK